MEELEQELAAGPAAVGTLLVPDPPPSSGLDKLAANIQAQRARQLRRLQQLTAKAAEAQ